MQLMFFTSLSANQMPFEGIQSYDGGKNKTKVKALRTNRGGKYLSDKFKVFCSLQGFTHQLMIALIPKPNGVSYRKNHMVLDRAQSMSQ